MSSEAVVEHVKGVLREHGAENIEVFSLMEKPDMAYADFVVLADGVSTRHVTALGEHVNREIKAEKSSTKVVGREGLQHGDWVVIDLESVVVHIMRAPVREYYKPQEMWK